MDRTQRARDAWIALRCQAGEADAFRTMVEEFSRPLLYYATKLLCNESLAFDAVQDLWLKAFQGVRKLHDPASLRPWLYRLAHGIAVDRIRCDQARHRAEQTYAESAAPHEPEPDLHGLDAADLHRALDELSLEHREVLVLHFLEQMPLAEVAEVVGCPPGTVKSRIHFAKRALKEILKRGGHDVPV